MAQNFTDDCFSGSHGAQSDMQTVEDNFGCLKSSFSGNSAPSNPVAGMDWYDTAKKVRRTRNYANSGWFGLMHADNSHAIYVYRNDTPEGWLTRDVTDRVLAVKGGGQAYNVSGGTNAGSWTQPDHNHSHAHSFTLSVANLPPHVHRQRGRVSEIDPSGPSAGIKHQSSGLATYVSTSTDDTASTGSGTTVSTSTDSNANASPNTWRPAAAVGTLQYLDI